MLHKNLAHEEEETLKTYQGNRQSWMISQKGGPIAKTSQEAIIKCSLTKASWNMERKIQSLQKRLIDLDAHFKDLIQHKWDDNYRVNVTSYLNGKKSEQGNTRMNSAF